MDILKRVKRLEGRALLALGKQSGIARNFAMQINAYSMYRRGYGLGISVDAPLDQQIRTAMQTIVHFDGYILFDISGVNLKTAHRGKLTCDFGTNNNMVTEWELSEIIKNPIYLRRTLFHNGKIELKQIYNFKTLRWTA